METFFDRLDTLYSTGNLTAVEEHILHTVDALTSAGHSNTLEFASIMNELAGFYRGTNRFDESNSAFRKALDVLEKCDLTQTPDYVTILLNQAGLQRLMGNTGEAIDMFLKSKSILENLQQESSNAYTNVLNNLSVVYQETDQVDLAIKYADTSLSKMREIDSPEHELAASLNSLSIMHLKKGDFASAEKHVSEALGLYVKMPVENVDYAAALATKATICYRKNDYIGALEGFSKSLELTGRFFGKNLEYAICERNLAEIYNVIGETASAAIHQESAVEILVNVLGDDHRSTAEGKNFLKRLNAEMKGM